MTQEDLNQLAVSNVLSADAQDAYEEGFKKALELVKVYLDSQYRECSNQEVGFWVNKLLDSVLEPFQELL